MSANFSASDMRFHTLRNALYHSARRRKMETWSRFSNFLTVVAGTAVAGNLFAMLRLETGPIDGTVFLGVMVTIIGAIQLVYDFSGRARTHELLQKEYFTLLSEIEKNIEPNEREIAQWAGEMAKIAGNEPPVLRALDASAYNEAADALFDNEHSRLQISFWQNLTKNIFSHSTAKFDTQGQKLLVSP